ncbi:MAG: glycosyltransferase family 4 protein [bacterium]
MPLSSIPTLESMVPGFSSGPAVRTKSNHRSNGSSQDPNSSSPLNICLLSYRSSPYSGGQGIYVKYLTRELSRRGHQVDVISGKPYPELDDSVNLIQLPGLNLYERESRLSAFSLDFLRDRNDLYEWLSVITGGFPEPYTFGQRVLNHLDSTEKNYDVIHDNQSLSKALVPLLENGYPVVSTIHHPITVDRQLDLSAAEDWGESLLIRRWYSFLSMQTEVAQDLPEIICVSESSKRRAINDFGIESNQASVVYNGIDTDLFRPLESVDEVPRRIMTTASADVPLKGLKYLLKAVARLKPDFPELELIVVGEPDSGSETDLLVTDLGIESSVEFFSEITHERMVELYASASLAVSPSLYEGFGLPAGEAMACGVPLVSTSGGALPEVVGDSGVIVPPANPSALAHAIGNLLLNPNKRKTLGRRGRQRILENFSWDEAAKKTESIYRRTIDRANR